MNLEKKLYRIPEKGQVAGVAAGMADYIKMDVTIMRLLWVLFAFFTGGFGIIIYIVFAIVIPKQPDDGAAEVIDVPPVKKSDKK